ncbi:MAG TPA: nucleotide exchange factor GrpE [Candidatus Saccharimonadales bacterium]|nr:nucleotide exchange factor GrpE [Candidatus Saccharimonadales bacterium]
MAKKKDDKNNERIKSLEEQLKRALADYQNLQKRTEEEKKQVIKFGNTLLIVKFLEILDHLEAAQKNLNDQGLELVIRRFKELLASENIKEIESEGASFDPNFHEAVAIVEGEEDGQITEVMQPGYFLDDKVIRPSRVKVIKKKVGAQE